MKEKVKGGEFDARPRAILPVKSNSTTVPPTIVIDSDGGGGATAPSS